MKYALVFLSFLALATTARAQASRPNFVFVLIDDMGWGDLNCYGGTRGKTPQIDRLASEGIRFTQFYVNAPICSPSRVAFLTGQYPGRWHITSYLDNRKIDKQRGLADWLDPKAPTLARTLSQAGYYTAHVGKWHMGGQRDIGDAPLITQYGFDTSLTSFEGLGERVLPQFENLPDHVPTSSNAKLGGTIHWVVRHKVTEAYVDRALKEIDSAASQKKPFYLNLWLDDVHTPIQAPPELRGDKSQSDQYGGVITEMDNQLGRVFEMIRSRPELRDNTVILLASDNGPEQGVGSSGGLRGSKGNLYEGGIREPLIVWSPSRVSKSAVGTVNETTVIAGMDFSSTLTAISGVKAGDAKLDGSDMSAAILGTNSAKRQTPVMWVRPPDRPGPKNSFPDLAIRDGDWKLLVFRDGSRPELFNIPADAKEQTNLASENQDVVQRLSKQVIEWDRATNGK